MTDFEAVNSTEVEAIAENKEGTELMHFKTLSGVDVSKKTKDKNKLTYLPWAEAVGAVKKYYPDATFEPVFFNGLPYLFDKETGYMVFTQVTIEGVTNKMWLPVLDANNFAMLDHEYEAKTMRNTFHVKKCTMADINKALMRCLCKNIALFGLGLFGIYAKEDEFAEFGMEGDLPNNMKAVPVSSKSAKPNAAAKAKSATSAQAVQMPTPIAPVSQAPVQVQNATPTTPAAPAIPTPAPVLKVVYESAGDGKTLKVSNLENPLVFNGMPTAAPTDELYIAAGKQVFTLTNDVFVKAGICNTDCRSALNKIISTHNTDALSELNNLLANASSLNEEGKKTLAAVSTMLSRFLFSDLTA